MDRTRALRALDGDPVSEDAAQANLEDYWARAHELWSDALADPKLTALPREDREMLRALCRTAAACAGLPALRSAGAPAPRT